jgi:hypothetical protein
MDNATEELIERNVRSAVAAGTEEVARIVEDTVDGYANRQTPRQWVRAVAWRAAVPAMAEHLAAQEGWPDPTDNDRLTAVFRELDRGGIVARERLGRTISDGRSLMFDQLVDGTAKGFVFYHQQDQEGAAERGALWLAFGGAGDQSAAEVGEQVAQTLGDHGLTVDWNGDPDTRIRVVMRWQVRRTGRLAVAEPPPGADFWDPTPPESIGWRGRPGVKEATTARLRARHAAGELVRGTAAGGPPGGRFDPGLPDGGCFGGYLTAGAVMRERGIDEGQFIQLAESGGVEWDAEIERLCGMPNRLVWTVANLFAKLPEADCADFLVETVEAVPVGADLAAVCDRWMLDVLTHPEHGAIVYATSDAARAATDAMAALYRQRLTGDEPDATRWNAVRNECRTSGADAASFAGDAYPLGAAEQVARRASMAAWQAADAEKDAAAEAARVAELRWHARRLVHHLATA